MSITWKRFVALSLCSIWILGCEITVDPDDITDQDPLPAKATVTFVHKVGDAGTIDIALNGNVSSTVASGVFTDAKEVDIGTYTLTLSNSGASQSFYQDADFILAAQGYLFSFSGSTSDVQVLAVDAAPPALAAGEAALEVVSMEDVQYNFDVYAGDTKIAADLAANTVSDFAKITSGTYTIAVRNVGIGPGDGAPVTTTEKEIGDKSATMILLQNDNSGVRISFVTVLP